MNEKSGAKSIGISGGEIKVSGDIVGRDKIVYGTPVPVIAALHQLPPPARRLHRTRIRTLRSPRRFRKRGRPHLRTPGPRRSRQDRPRFKTSRRARPQIPRRPNLSRPKRSQRETPNRRRSPVPRPPHLPSRSQAARIRRRPLHSFQFRSPRQARPTPNGQRQRRRPGEIADPARGMYTARHLPLPLHVARSPTETSRYPDRKSTRLNSSHLGISYA